MFRMENTLWRRAVCSVVALILLMTAPAFGEAAPAPGLQQDVVVLFTSDVHCGVDEGFGYAGLAAIRDALKAQGLHVLLVDDGDAVQGGAIGLMTQGEAVIDLMNEVGYDVAIPGNHEFDYGASHFISLAERAEFPYVSCNFNHLGELVFEPYVIREFDGVKIAFVGATTPASLTSSTPRFFQDADGNFVFGFMGGNQGAELYAAIQGAVDAARGEGADYVILMAHLGNAGDAHPYNYADVIANTRGIDAVLDGHSHDKDKVVMNNLDGQSVVRQACGTKLEGVGWLRITAADGSLDTGLYIWNNEPSVPRLLGLQTPIEAHVAQALADLDAMLGEVVGVSSVDLTISAPGLVDDSGRPVRIVRRAETNLGDLVADAFRVRSGADVAVVGGGGIRTNISKGEITMNDVLATFPFGNRLYMAEVTGQQILDALEWGARSVPEEHGGFLHVSSGMRYEIHTYIPSSCTQNDNGMCTGIAGEYRVKNVTIDGEPLDLEKTYTLAALDYTLLNHGDGFTAFDGARTLWEADKTDCFVLADFIREDLGGNVSKGYENPYGEGRIVAVETAEGK